MNSQRIAKRRRRVALDQNQSVDSAQSPSESNGSRTAQRDRNTSRPYEKGARRSRQFKTTDLIPKRGWSVAAIVALAFAAIAALNLLHLNSPDWIQVIGQEGIEALSLDSRTGLAVWYSNFLLLLTACVSLQLFLLRQHRRDDYRGSYRIWIFLAFVFLVASAASVTGITSAVGNVTDHFLGSSQLGNGIALILIAKLVGLLILFVRTFVEVRHSRLAVMGLVMVLTAYAGAAVISEVPAAQSKASEYIHSACGNCLLFGATGIFLTALTFARFVYLEANGLVGKSKRKRVSQEVAAPANTESAVDEVSEDEVERLSWVDSMRSRRADRKAQRVAAREERQAEKADRRAERQLEKEAARDEKLAARRRRTKGKAAAKEEARRQAEEARIEREIKEEENAKEAKRSKKQRKEKTAAEQNEQPAAQPQRNTKSSKGQNKKSAKPASPLQSRVNKVVSGKAAASGQALEKGSEHTSSKTSKTQRKTKSSASPAVSAADQHLLSLPDEEVESLSKSERRRLRKLKRRAA